MSPGQLVLAYHGCDVTVRDRLVKGALAGLTPSSNRYDWLGDGVYFFEGDAKRALSFAQAAQRQTDKFYSARPIVTPSVVGAVLCITRCWDMTTTDGRWEYRMAFDELRQLRTSMGRAMPVNGPAHEGDDALLLRGLDCAVFNMGHRIRERDGLLSHQLVRAAFYQGRPVIEASEFREGTHLQLAVRDPQCVLGWFLPEGVGSAVLSELELQEADAALALAVGARTASKPRRRMTP